MDIKFSFRLVILLSKERYIRYNIFFILTHFILKKVKIELYHNLHPFILHGKYIYFFEHLYTT